MPSTPKNAAAPKAQADAVTPKGAAEVGPRRRAGYSDRCSRSKSPEENSLGEARTSATADAAQAVQEDTKASEASTGVPESLEASAQAPDDEQHLPPQPVNEVEIAKWSEMMEGYGIGIYEFIRLHPDRFLRRVRRGIPPQFRWEVWKAALHLHKQEHILAQDYKKLSTQDNAHTKQIEIDIARTFPDLKTFAQEQQQKLLRVLNAYAAYNPKLGYCQGMNFVAGLLLLVSNFQEEECFGVLVCLMDHAGLAGFYGEKLLLFRRYLRACDKLVQETVPDLRDHFKKENVHAEMYLHQWFLTLFINCFPLTMVIIIWDVIICEGLEVVLRIAVSILQVLKDSLLAMQFEEIIKFFKMMRTYDDEDSELNAFKIGQLLMKHTELVKVPQNILDELRSDAADDEPWTNDPESWEANKSSSGTWFTLTGFGRVMPSGVMSFFNYGSAKSAPRSGNDSSNSSSTFFGNTASHSSSGSQHSEERPATRSWDFL
jgi:hypothetical protein